MDDMPASVQELMFTEAVRALDGQHRQLDALRTRAVTLLSVSTIAGTGFALGAKSLRWWQAAPTLALAGLAIFVLFPRAFTWVNDVTGVIAELDANPDNGGAAMLSDVQRDWALWMARNYDANKQAMQRLPTAIFAACGVLAIQFVIGLVALTRH